MTQSKAHYQLSIVKMDWTPNIEPIQNEQRTISILAEHKNVHWIESY